MSLPEPEIVDWAYLAGYLDAEGCITLQNNRARGRFYPRVTLTQKRPLPLLILREVFGGRLRRDRNTFKLLWESRSKVIHLLSGLLPDLRQKRREAQVLLAACTHPEGSDYRRRAYYLLQKIKRRGYRPSPGVLAAALSKRATRTSTE